MRSNAPRLLLEFREFQRRNGAHSHYRHLAITSRATPQRHTGAADAAIAGATRAWPTTGACTLVTRALWRGANAADRATNLSALSSGAAGLHPHSRAAHAATGHGAMIGADASAAIVRSCRCVPRHATEIPCHQRSRLPRLCSRWRYRSS
jgi:hypothetical protein